MAIPYSSSFDETIPFSDECAQLNLNKDVAQAYTIPGDNRKKYSVLFNYTKDSNVWVSLNGTAAAPTLGAKTETKRMEFKPGKRYMIGGDVLSLVTPDSQAYVGISLRSIPA